MNDTDKIAMLFRKIDDLAARHQAREALFEHLTAPIYLAVIPHALAVELIAAARTFDVKLPDGTQKLLIEEHINDRRSPRAEAALEGGASAIKDESPWRRSILHLDPSR